MENTEAWASGDAQVGQTVTLSTSSGNHPPEEWARATAQIILNIEGVPTPERLVKAIDLQRKAALLLCKYYDAVIEKEVLSLQNFTDQCDADYDVDILARKARDEVQYVSLGTLWHSLTHSADWAESAYETIASHLATAIHVERLLFADSNPTNASAIAYKARFTG